MCLSFECGFPCDYWTNQIWPTGNGHEIFLCFEEKPCSPDRAHRSNKILLVSRNNHCVRARDTEKPCNCEDIPECAWQAPTAWDLKGLPDTSFYKKTTWNEETRLTFTEDKNSLTYINSTRDFLFFILKGPYLPMFQFIFRQSVIWMQAYGQDFIFKWIYFSKLCKVKFWWQLYTTCFWRRMNEPLFTFFLLQ